MRRRNYTPDCKEKVQSGEWRVETYCGKPGRVICFDAKGGERNDDLVVMVQGSLGAENIVRYYSDGTLLSCRNNESMRLMVVTDEPAIDLFEHTLAEITNNEIAYEYTPYLKSLARKGYIRIDEEDAYVLETILASRDGKDMISRTLKDMLREYNESNAVKDYGLEEKNCVQRRHVCDCYH